MLRHYLILILILAVAVGVRLAYIPAKPVLNDTVIGAGEIARNIDDHGRWLELNLRAIELVKDLHEREHRFAEPAAVNFAATDAKPRWQRFADGSSGPGIVLAGIWKLTGSERYIYGDIAQIAVDALMTLLVYRAVMLLFGRRRTALIAAALYAVFPPIAQRTSFVNPDIWAVDFTIAIVAVYLESMRSAHRMRLLLICGVIVGIGLYFRPNLVLLPGALALASLGRNSWRRQLGDAAVVTAIAVVVMAPWVITNSVHFHRFIPTRTNMGVTLWVGLAEIHNNLGVIGDEGQIYAEVHRVRPDIVKDTPEYDAYMRKKALHLIEHHPFYYGKLVARRMVLSTVGEYESGWMHSNGESPVRYQARTGRGLLSYALNRPFDLVQSALQPIVFLLAIVGLVYTWRARRCEHLVLIAAVLATLIPYWVIHYETRFVLPVSFVYIVWISLVADLLVDRVSLPLRMPLTRRASRAESLVPPQ
jgi:4-amino-4-deoxy-L-arabinose transferase-like glycosyltransferase